MEVYGLTRSVSTTHLENFLLDFIWGTTAPNIKWVDDEHALAVFPCAEAAQVLLDAPQRTYKVRPYSKASKGALHIASEGEGGEGPTVMGATFTVPPQRHTYIHICAFPASSLAALVLR